MTLTFTFAGDEAGDVSFAFQKGASRHFVLAMIATAKPDDLRRVLTTVCRQAGLPAQYEFSFHALSSARLRRKVFAELAQAEFEGWALIVDKTALTDAFKVMNGLELYLYFVTELIRLIPADQREAATLILDEFTSAARLRVELRRFLAARNISHGFKRVQVRRSRSEPLIQVADLIAGAILRRDSQKDVEAFDAVAHKMKQVFQFHL